MANFCNKCGARSDGGPFCGGCGADMRKAPAVAQPQSPVVVAQSAVQPQAFQSVPAVPSLPAVPVATPAKSSPLVKILIAVVAIIFVGGALLVGGIYYVVYRVKEKVQEVKTQVLGETASNPSGPSGTTANSAGNDGCHLLNKEEVSQALGVEIVATESTDGGCSYLAAGSSADMGAKHATAMTGINGADAKTKQTMQGLAGGLFRTLQSENPKDTPDKDGKVPVLSFSIDNNSAETQIELNEKILRRLGPPEPPITGIGDHAFSAAGSMIMVRKGDKLIRILYTLCPCNTSAIKPLAKKLTDRV